MKLVEKDLSVSEQTKQELAAALKVLMAQKPMDKIAISELTGMCRIRRQSFYYHFEDIYDLLRWMLQNEAVVLLQQHEGTLLWQEGLLQMFRYLEENRAVCLCALKSVGTGPYPALFRGGHLCRHPPHHRAPGRGDRRGGRPARYCGCGPADPLPCPVAGGHAGKLAAGPVSESANRANCAEVRCGVFRGDGSRTAAPGGCPGGKEFRWRWCRSGGPLPPPGCSRRRPGQ